MLEVLTVDASVLDNLEQLGTKPKFWYDEQTYLFKSRRDGTGEDWSEVISARLAAQLGLPHAAYDLAYAVGVPAFDQVRGVRSTNFSKGASRFVLGNELIGAIASSGASPPWEELLGAVSRGDELTNWCVSFDETAERQAVRRQFHTPSRLAAILSVGAIGTPRGWSPSRIPMSPRGFRPGLTALGVMAGYLLLDVLIGNQDRHEENWGLLVHGGEISLAPTFDHASSLGRNETDLVMERKLAEKHAAHGMAGYCAKAKSQLYERSGRRFSTLGAFHAYAHHCKDQANFWLAQLERVNEISFRLLLNEVPSTHISAVAREFAIQLLIENRKRLLAYKT